MMLATHIFEARVKPRFFYFCAVINIISMSVLDKYLSGDSFTGTGKGNKVDVDKWIARHSAKPIPAKIITEETYNPESKIARELRELQPFSPTVVLPTKKARVIPKENKDIHRVDAMASEKQIDTIIVWLPNIAIDEAVGSTAKNEIIIGINVSKSLKKKMGEVAGKERITKSHLFQVILKKFVSDNSEMPNYESAEKNDCQVSTRITEDLKNRLNLGRNMSKQLRGIIKMYLDKYE